MDYISVNFEVLYIQFVFNQYHFITCREFSKRMDTYVPFCYNLYISHLMKDQIMMQTKMIFTMKPLRLHGLRLNQREDSPIFLVGRTYLPASRQQTILQLTWKLSCSTFLRWLPKSTFSNFQLNISLLLLLLLLFWVEK